MSLTVDKAVFTEALGAVSSVVKGKLAHPVLGYVKLEALKVEGASVVFLTATDLDQYCRRSVEADVSSEFTCLLPTRMVREWLAGISSGKLRVALNDQKISLAVSTNVIEIGTLPPADFPPWPKYEDSIIATTDLAPVTAVMGAASDGTRLDLFDIQISHAGEDLMRACAARGVVFAEHLFPGKTKEGHTIHITPPTIEHVSRLGQCSIGEGPNFVVFAGYGFVFLSKKLSNKTHDFKAQFDKWKFPASATIIREEFIEAVASCHVLRDPELQANALVTIEAEEDGLNIRCKNKLGQFHGFIAARVEGQFDPVILPSGQLLQPMRASTEDTVELAVTAPVQVARLTLGPTTFFFATCLES